MKRSNSIRLFGTFANIAQNEKSGKIIDIPDETEVDAIASGLQHCVFTTKSGDSYAIGSNSHGQLGLGTNEDANEFIKIQTSIKFSKVICGNNFTIWKSQDNTFYVSGENFSNKLERFPLETSEINLNGNSLSCIVNGNTFRFYENYFTNKYVETFLPVYPQTITCSSTYSLALCQGSVFMLDSNGILSCIFNYYPKIVSILSSSTYSMALDFNGNLYMLGDIIGMKRSNPEGKIASQISCFYTLPKQAYYQTERYQLFGFGHNDKGQLGDGTDKKRVCGTSINVDGIAKGISGNGDFTFIVQTPFNEELLSNGTSKIAPDLLSSPPEAAQDLLP